MTPKDKYTILLILSLIALTFSIVISFTKVSALCLPGEGCDTVLNSKYAEILGIKFSTLGTIAFTFLVILTFSYMVKQKLWKKKLINIGIVFGSLIAIYFLYLQQFILQAYCKYCLVVDISALLALAIIILYRKNERTNNSTGS